MPQISAPVASAEYSRWRETASWMRLAEIGRYPFHGGTPAERAGLTDPDPVPEREPDRGADSSAIHLFGFRIKPS